MSLTGLLENLSTPITRAGINQRFDESVCNFLCNVYSHVFTIMAKTHQKPLPVDIFKKFKSIKINDSSSWKVPAALKEHFPGYNQAGCKIQFMLDYKTGTIQYHDIGPETNTDPQFSKNICDLLQKDDLSLFDLGFAIPEALHKIDAKGAFFICRFNDRGNNIYKNDDHSSRPIDVLTCLNQLHHEKAVYEVPCFIGNERLKIKARLLAIKVPEEIANRRRHKLRVQGQKKGRIPTEGSLNLCDWNLLITNIPTQKNLTFQEILALYAIRWTIEIFFKQLKSGLNIHHTFVKSNPCRLKAEILARSIIALFITYCFAISRHYLWCHAKREISFEKTVKYFKRHAAILMDKLLRSIHYGICYLQQMVRKIIASCEKFRQPSRRNSLDRLIDQISYGVYKHIKLTIAQLVGLTA